MDLMLNKIAIIKTDTEESNPKLEEKKDGGGWNML
jgi:hypothetical protein